MLIVTFTKAATAELKNKITVADGGIGELSQKIYDNITGIQTGKVEDTFGWTVRI